MLDEGNYIDTPVVLLAKDAEVELLHWVNARKTSALVPWESYQEVAGSLQSLLAPEDKSNNQQTIVVLTLHPHVYFLLMIQKVSVLFIEKC